MMMIILVSQLPTTEVDTDMVNEEVPYSYVKTEAKEGSKSCNVL